MVLSAQALLSCFILIIGLKPQIRREVQALQQTFKSQAIGLANLQENKFLDIKHNPNLFRRIILHHPYVARPRHALNPKLPLLLKPNNITLVKIITY